jgi:HTH-type transcriptional regulator/antitoxin HigA
MPNTATRTARSGKSPAAAENAYAALLASFRPVAIETEAENERALAIVAELMGRPVLSRAEKALLKLLAILIEHFEQAHYSLGEATVAETLEELMRARGMTAKDLWPVFGSKGTTSEVLSGKRAISKEKAKRLAELFHVPAHVFI